MKFRHKLTVLTAVSLAVGLCATAVWGAHRTQERLAEKLIRLHVIANSDSEADQALKIQVRDAILREAEEILTVCADLDEAEEQLGAALDRMAAAAEETVARAGYAYPVSAALSFERYPTREYASFKLPAGRYLSLRITIGAGEGRNWWCVVFPPLCLASVSEQSVESAAEGVLSDDQVALITGQDGGYVLKFRLVEWWQELTGGK